MKLIRIIPFITTAAIMTAIFIFSSQTSEQSSHLSSGITKKLVEVIAKIINLPDNRIDPVTSDIHSFIRKAAHFTIYGTLGFSASAMFVSAMKNAKKQTILICSAVFCCIYAISDEIHQNFVSGRGPQITDVLLDTAGSICGAALLLIIIYSYSKRRKGYGK